jgi:alpha-N-arabinofuranosidase
MATFTNPVIPGFYPDPSICRVKADYYLVTSTFEFFPGVPIFHSRDLVNWKQIGHVLDRPAQLNLNTANDSCGIYAPTIRAFNGMFYMITTVANRTEQGNTHRNFYCTAEDPAGPWSEPVILPDAPGIDPSLLFDNGKMIYCGNIKPELHGGKSKWLYHRNIWAQEIDPARGVLIGEKKIIIDCADWDDQYGQEKCNAWEAPHLYRKDDWYYLLLASGGTGWGHSLYIFRSKNLYGPYTEACPANPIMTNRHLPKETWPVHCPGHGDLVYTHSGEWWMVILATRPYAGYHNYLGRETMLVPIDWSSDWPLIKDGARDVKLSYARPALTEHPCTPEPVRDDFDQPTLGFAWNFLRTPRETWWDLKTKPGTLQILTRPHRLQDHENSSFIGRRVTDLEFTATTVVSFTPRGAMEEAGMVMYKSSKAFFRMVLRTSPDAKKSICLIKRLMQDDRDSVMAEVPAPDGPVQFRLGTRDRKYYFSWSADGQNWQMLDNTFDVSCLAQVVCGGFTGIYVGMFAGSNGQPSTNHADFDWFEYRAAEAQKK